MWALLKVQSPVVGENHYPGRNYWMTYNFPPLVYILGMLLVCVPSNTYTGWLNCTTSPHTSHNFLSKYLLFLNGIWCNVISNKSNHCIFHKKLSKIFLVLSVSVLFRNSCNFVMFLYLSNCYYNCVAKQVVFILQQHGIKLNFSLLSNHTLYILIFFIYLVYITLPFQSISSQFQFLLPCFVFTFLLRNNPRLSVNLFKEKCWF